MASWVGDIPKRSKITAIAEKIIKNIEMYDISESRMSLRRFFISFNFNPVDLYRDIFLLKIKDKQRK